MTEVIQSYKDWKDFFTKRLTQNGAFTLTSTTSKGDTDIEIYSALKGNHDTKIEVGYFSPMILIYIHIFNPATPGKNRQQEIEHLYKYEFDPKKQYGLPGLDFNEINIQGISNYLEQGFEGNEIVYYRNRKPIKSKLTTSHYSDSPKMTITYHFNNTPLYKRLLQNFFGRDAKYDEIKHVDLRNVFSGLKDS